MMMNLKEKACEAFWWLMPLATFVVGSFLTAPIYTVDDAHNVMIVQGKGVVTSPQPILLYSSVYLARLLSFLYTHFSNVPWYWIWVTGLHLGTDLVLSSVILRPKVSAFSVLVLLAYFVTVSLPNYTLVSYTAAASLAAVGAGLLVLKGIFAGRLSIKDHFIVFGLVAGSACTRDKALFLVTFPALVVAALLTLKRPAERFGVDPRVARRPFVFYLVVILGIPALIHLTSRHILTSKGWGEFIEFNSLKQQALDYGRLPEKDRWQTAIHTIGWSPVDLEMLLAWFLMDRDVYSNENLKQLISHYRFPGMRVLKEIGPGFWDNPVLCYLILLLLCVVGQLVNSHGLAIGVGFSSAILSILAVLGFYYHRVTYQTLVPFYGGILVIGLYLIQRTYSKITQFAALACTAYFLQIAIHMEWDYYQQRKDFIRLTQSFSSNYSKEKIYVLWNVQPFLKGLSPLKNLAEIDGFSFFLPGTLAGTPFFDEQLKSLKISDPYHLLTDERVEIFAAPTDSRLLKPFLLQHDKRTLDISISEVDGSKYFPSIHLITIRDTGKS